jgi:hypothetical protein
MMFKNNNFVNESSSQLIFIPKGAIEDVIVKIKEGLIQTRVL